MSQSQVPDVERQPASSALHPDLVLPEERIARVIQAALGAAEEIMGELGLSRQMIAGEFLSQAICEVWGDDDRETMKAKAQALLAERVDALFDVIGA